MSDDDQKPNEQRRRDIVAQARATLARIKDIQPRPVDPLSGGHWRPRADRHAEDAKAEQALFERLEQRLVEERDLMLDALNEALEQAIAGLREFVRKLISEECGKRDGELNSQFQRLWDSLAAEHTALVAIQQEAEARAKTKRRLAELFDVHADPATKLH
jgi:hypothetical protein